MGKIEVNSGDKLGEERGTRKEFQVKEKAIPKRQLQF